MAMPAPQEEQQRPAVQQNPKPLNPKPTEGASVSGTTRHEALSGLQPENQHSLLPSGSIYTTINE